ncbi:hypothetical protein [Streptomyces hypolithicus]
MAKSPGSSLPKPWFATSLAVVAARGILEDRPLKVDERECRRLGTYGTDRMLYEEY